MKKVLAMAFVSVCAFLAIGVCAFADIGPKPSVVVYVNGVEDGIEYYIALLSSSKSGYNDRYIESRDDVWRKLYEFSDADGFGLAESPVDPPYFKMKGRDSARWGYTPPKTFKILLYFPDNESFLVSGAEEKYAFDAYYTVNVSGDALTVVPNGGAKGIAVEAAGLLIRIAATVLIELGIALLFKYRGKRELRFILITNIVTQILLNALVAAGDISLGSVGAFFALAAGEIAVFIAEAVLYSANLPRITELKTRGGAAVGYAFAANLASFFGGGALMIVTDMLFTLMLR